MGKIWANIIGELVRNWGKIECVNQGKLVGNVGQIQGKLVWELVRKYKENYG